MCPINFRIWFPFDHNNIGHDHQQSSTAPEQVYPTCPNSPKYISVKLLHDSSGLPYVKDRLLSCGNRWTWNKMDAKFGFFIKFYARIQIFRSLGPTKLFYGHLKITRFFNNYMDFPYENKSVRNFHFYLEKPYKNLRKRQFSNSCKNSLPGRIDTKFCN